MPNTTNFNWPTPADTDLVKDGAAAIRNLGNGIDTSLIDLKGGTTGQILSKASNADMDFTFITPNVGDITEVQAGTGISVASGTGPIPVVTNSMATEITAKGDLIVGTGSGTFDNLPAGTNGHILVADSSTATGLAYAAPASGNKTYTLLNTGGTALSGSSTVTVSVTTKEDYAVIITGVTTANRNDIAMRINGDTGSNYEQLYLRVEADATYAAAGFNGVALTTTSIIGGTRSTNGSSVYMFALFVSAGNSTTIHPFTYVSGATNATGNQHSNRNGQGIYTGTAAITSFSVLNLAAANFTGGTMYIYGA